MNCVKNHFVNKGAEYEGKIADTLSRVFHDEICPARFRRSAGRASFEQHLLETTHFLRFFASLSLSVLYGAITFNVCGLLISWVQKNAFPKAH